MVFRTIILISLLTLMATRPTLADNKTEKGKRFNTVYLAALTKIARLESEARRHDATTKTIQQEAEQLRDQAKNMDQKAAQSNLRSKLLRMHAKKILRLLHRAMNQQYLKRSDRTVEEKAQTAPDAVNKEPLRVSMQHRLGPSED